MKVLTFLDTKIFNHLHFTHNNFLRDFRHHRQSNKPITMPNEFRSPRSTVSTIVALRSVDQDTGSVIESKNKHQKGGRRNRERMEKARLTTAIAALTCCLVHLPVSPYLLHHLVLMMTPPNLDGGRADEDVNMANQVAESGLDTDHGLAGNSSVDIVKKTTVVNGINFATGRSAGKVKSLIAR